MRRTNENEQNGIVVIRVPDRIVQFVLLELAWALDYAAWTRISTHELIWVECSKEEALELLELARPIQKLLRLRKLEVIAEAVLKAGARPSGDLLRAIRQTRVQGERDRSFGQTSRCRDRRLDLN